MRSIHGMESDPFARPTIICLHASGSSGAQWKALGDELRHDFRVLTPDLYGHGTAPAWSGAPADIVAADAARIGGAVADSAGDVHLVGHSYGGAIALRVALRHPGRVTSVVVYEPVAMRVLFDYNPKHRPAAEVAEVAADIGRALNGERVELAARVFVDYWSGAGQWARLASDRKASIARRMRVIHSHFLSLTHDAIRLRDYARIEAPVLYLAGRGTRASARRIAELLEFALPNREFETLDDMGHLGPITHAERVAQRIANFVRRQAAAPTVDDRKAA